MPWIVGVTKPNAEAVAATHLERQGYQYYLPRIRQAKPGKAPSVEPLFRRYIFIFITERWYPLRSTRGISHLLMKDAGPSRVPESTIAGLRSRHDKDGFVQLTTPDKYQIGDKVRVEDGPFAGHIALYEGMAPHDRCQVLLSLMHRAVSVTLDERYLAAA